MSKRVGLTDRRLRQLAGEGWFPAPEKGLYNLDECYCGLIRYYKHMSSSDDRKENLRLKNAILQHQLEVKQKSVVPMDALRLVNSRAQNACRTRLLSIPSTMAARLALTKTPSEIEALLLTEVNQALDDLRKCPWSEELSTLADFQEKFAARSKSTTKR